MKKEIQKVVGYLETDALVRAIKGGTFVSVEYVTPIEKMNKKLVGGKSNEFYGRLSSRTIATNLKVAWDYEGNVNNALKEKGLDASFVAEKLPWGVWNTAPDGTADYKRIISHKGEHYFRLYDDGSNFTTTYYLDGVEVTDEYLKKSIIAAIYKKVGSAKQAACGLIGEDQVKPMNVAYKNLKRICTDKKCYLIEVD